MTRGNLTSVALLLGAVVCLAVAQERPQEQKAAGPKVAAPSPITQKTVTSTVPKRPQASSVGHALFESPHAMPIAVWGGDVFVVNTPCGTLDVIEAASRQVRARVRVGVEPVSVAVRPDGREVWVSNHVSDSVSVIDIKSDSPTYLQVVATIQEFDPATKATRFDEPVSIAFASNDKAYVALSSENQIAVVDVATRKITKRLKIKAQDPRAIVVRDGKLFVIPFESNNQTQLSGGRKSAIDGKLVTFDAWEHSVLVNNVLSLGHVVDIVKQPQVPDRDLFVFDTANDEPLVTIDSLGTLLSGLTVDSRGRVFIAQTDARNDANGRAGTQKHGLKELENRAFLNRITRVEFGEKDGSQDSARRTFFDLEPMPPQQPAKAQALATPFAIEISRDDATLVVTAAGSDKLFTVDANSGVVLGRVAVGAVPRGIALEHSDNGRPSRAWVFNAVANTVSLIDLSDIAKPQVSGFVALEDPTPRAIKLGRTWFNDADASSTGTFSCASCHPDGHTDQLLWVLKTPIVTGGNQIMPRSTMPIRGLRDTAPFHWDGIPGDPYGGINSASVHASVAPNSDIDEPASNARHLIDGGLASTMLLDGDTTVNDEGKSGLLTAAERDEMAAYLLSVAYPPAQRRAFTDVVSARARRGFQLFHIDGDLDDKPQPNVCGDCHRLPYLVSTNTPGTGMDAPTWRGAYDRFLILPQGRLNIMEFDFFARVANEGFDERRIWQFSWGGRPRFDPVWDMVLEASTGFSGAFGRQVTLSKESVAQPLTTELLEALETAARERTVCLEGHGVRLDGHARTLVSLYFDPSENGGAYVSSTDSADRLSREQILEYARDGHFIGTFTARHGTNAVADRAQPAIWTLGPIEQQRGRQEFPILHADLREMSFSGRHLDASAHILVDGRRVAGTMTLGDNERVDLALEQLPPVGLHLLQLQNPDGLLSNEFLFHVVENSESAAALKHATAEHHADIRNKLAEAIVRGDKDEIAKILARQPQRLNEPRPEGGLTPLSTAALHGRLDMAKLLLERGAKVDATNQDGNTALHVAAFLCQTDIVKLLLEKGSPLGKKNNRNELPIDVVSGQWTPSLADFYTAIGKATSQDLDLERLKRTRPEIAELLRSPVGKREE